MICEYKVVGLEVCQYLFDSLEWG